MEEFKVLHEKNVFNKALVIREGEINEGEKHFRRLGVDRWRGFICITQ
ncbi:MAG TPA: hypothetical protein VN026_07530 [Bacteroidia bacterium]|jgi:hypothetical protein|nr:hypothetical protein [Bacteroidia bacterium]